MGKRDNGDSGKGGRRGKLFNKVTGNMNPIGRFQRKRKLP